MRGDIATLWWRHRAINARWAFIARTRGECEDLNAPRTSGVRSYLY